jgi:hypothetical protein
MAPFSGCTEKEHSEQKKKKKKKKKKGKKKWSGEMVKEKR